VKSIQRSVTSAAKHCIRRRALEASAPDDALVAISTQMPGKEDHMQQRREHRITSCNFLLGRSRKGAHSKRHSKRKCPRRWKQYTGLQCLTATSSCVSLLLPPTAQPESNRYAVRNRFSAPSHTMVSEQKTFRYDNILCSGRYDPQTCDRMYVRMLRQRQMY